MDTKYKRKNGIDSHLINYAWNIETGPLALIFDMRVDNDIQTSNTKEKNGTEKVLKDTEKVHKRYWKGTQEYSWYWKCNFKANGHSFDI